MAKFVEFNTEQKKQFAKRFSKNERESYRKGQRNEWLKNYHNSKKINRPPERKYTNKEINALFDNLKNVKF